MTKEQRKAFRKAYRTQKSGASKRGIEWLFTSFEQWLEWWGDDIYNRGHCRGQLVMARYNDIGPYHPGNVRKLPCEHNVSEGQLGHKDSAETCLKRSKSLMGHSISDYVKQQISLANKGRPAHNRKRIMTPEGEFESKSAAARHFNKDSAVISDRLKKYPTEYYYL